MSEYRDIKIEWLREFIKQQSIIEGYVTECPSFETTPSISDVSKQLAINLQVLIKVYIEFLVKTQPHLKKEGLEELFIEISNKHGFPNDLIKDNKD